MLMAQLRYAALKLAKEVDRTAPDSPHEFLEDLAGTLQGRYERFSGKIKLKVVDIDRLELSKPDREFYKDLKEGRKPSPQRVSHERLQSAWDRIGAKLDAIVAAEPTDVAKAEALSAVDTVVESDWILIHMVADSKEEAYRLFRVLNDRGTGLTEGELLRSQVLEALDGAAPGAVLQQVEDIWDQLLSVDPDAVESQLRSIYASRAGRRAGKTTLLDELVAQLFPELQQLPLDTVKVARVVDEVKDLQREIGLLAKLTAGEWPYPSSSKVTAWDRSRLGLLMVELKHTNCLPLLLAATKLKETDFAEVVQMLERFMFRYKVICNAHISAASTVYHEQAVEIRKDPAKYKIAALRDKLQALLDKSAKDALFQSRLQTLLYSRDGGNRNLKYFLITMENYLKWYRAGANGAPKCLDKMVVFDPAATTIEHVYPAGATPPDPALEPLLDTLGNLTLLGSKDNDAAGNKPFNQKQAILKNSPLLLNQEVAAKPQWDASVVTARQSDLEAAALRIFRTKG
jgi:hypothetical protein